MFRKKGTALPERAFSIMRSDDVDTLQILVNAATDWRTAAIAQNVNITMLTTQINGQTVILEWDDTNSIWNIRTD